MNSHPVPTRSPVPTPPGPTRPARYSGTNQMNGDRLSVIVVDDHELSRKGLVALLEQRGIRVAAEAGLATEGIRQAFELTPDVVVMDLGMPGMSGIEATQRLTATAPCVCWCSRPCPTFTR
jgi:CheY-like chemotaxis protein